MKDIKDLKGVDFVVLAANNDGRINFSLRSENSGWNCGLIIQEALKGIGFGGGHSDMAGGIINDSALFEEKAVYKKFIGLLK